MKEIFKINLQKKVPIVAEIGVNHEGSLSKAKKLISLAYKSGADAVKIQCFTPEKYSSKSDKKRFNQVSKFAFSKKSYLILLNYAKKLKIPFFATPLTEDWVDIVAKTCPVIKIASGDINFFPTIKKCARSEKKIILSTGLATFNEVKKAINCIKRNSKVNLRFHL